MWNMRDQNPTVCWDGFRLGSLIWLSSIFKSVTTASVAYSAVVNVNRFKNQNCWIGWSTPRNCFVFCIIDICSIVIYKASDAYVLTVCHASLLKGIGAGSLGAFAKEDNDLLKGKGKNGSSFFLPYSHGLSNFSITRHLIIFDFTYQTCIVYSMWSRNPPHFHFPSIWSFTPPLLFFCLGCSDVHTKLLENE